MRRIGELAAEVLAGVSSKRELVETAGASEGVIAWEHPGRVKQNETTVRLRRSNVGRIANLEASGEAVKGGEHSRSPQVLGSQQGGTRSGRTDEDVLEGGSRTGRT